MSLSLVGSLPRHRTMSDGEGGEGEEEAAVWRRVFEPRARVWADGRGIVALLGSLEAALPHVLGLACAKKESADGPSPTPRPWVPDGDSERAVGLAYRRASRHLHPDRTSSRDLSVRVEAEEYLKVLTAAFDDKDAWQKDDAAKAARASPGATDGNSARSNDSPGADVVGGNDLRDAVFGHQAPRPQARPPPPPPPPAAVDGGQGLRDTMFADMKGPPKPQAPPPVPQRDAPTASAIGSATGEGKKKTLFSGFGARSKKDKGGKEAEGKAPPPVPPPKSRSPFDAPPAAVPNPSFSAADALFGGGAANDPFGPGPTAPNHPFGPAPGYGAPPSQRSAPVDLSDNLFGPTPSHPRPADPHDLFGTAPSVNAADAAEQLFRPNSHGSSASTGSNPFADNPFA